MKKTVYIILAAVAALTLSCTKIPMNNGNDGPLHNKGEEVRPDEGEQQPEGVYKKVEDALRIVSYNVGAFSKYQKHSEVMISDMMKEVKADVMVMNEVDRNTPRNPYDQPSTFAGLMGWNSHFGKTINLGKGEYGNAICYDRKFKEVSSFIIPLPTVSGGENRNCVVVEFEKFVLAGTHLDQTNELNRKDAIAKINEAMQSRYGNGKKPVFLCGDMNAEPQSETLKELQKDWDVLSAQKNTFPSTGPVKCIDFILRLKKGKACRITATDVMTTFNKGNVKQASDHLPVYVDVIL